MSGELSPALEVHEGGGIEVRMDAFEGPLDLLLYLIKRQNLDVLEINVAEITKQYMTYIEMMQAIELELVAEYLVEQYGDTDVRIALAGRSLSKLEGVRSELARIRPDAAELPLLTGDSFDLEALTPAAEEIGITPEMVATPLEEIPESPCPTFQRARYERALAAG